MCVCVCLCLCKREGMCVCLCTVCVDSLSLESCRESGFMGVGSLQERLKLLALRSANADEVSRRRGRQGKECHSEPHTQTPNHTHTYTHSHTHTQQICKYNDNSKNDTQMKWSTCKLWDMTNAYIRQSPRPAALYAVKMMRHKRNPRPV